MIDLDRDVDDSSPVLPAMSAPRRPHLSITLPWNFAPLSLDGRAEPKTPDQTFSELKLPPPVPHHSTARIRRPRIKVDNFQTRNNALPPTLFASDIPIPSSGEPMASEFSWSDVPLPSIEVSSGGHVRPLYQRGSTDPSPSERLRLPAYRGPQQLPRTPPAQTKTPTAELRQSAWDMHRSTSQGSIRSDSSLSSSGTFTTRPTSFDGSATSPDVDSHDPFSPSKVHIIPDTPSRKSKKLRLNPLLPKGNVQWSIEMDNHLFNVYQMYLADPTVTPFKTVPGSIPPTGVCHRVARRAKETWPRASRISRPIVRRYKLRNVLDARSVGVREKTPELNDFLKTDSSGHDGRGAWPSESATRRRLKQLCRDKFTISAHYQRLRESRSPSPFHEQFLRRPSSRLSRATSRPLGESETSTTTYATRELGISLVASDATAPLAQLVTGDSSPPTQRMSDDDWFNTPVNASSSAAASTDSMNMSPPPTGPASVETAADKLSVASSIPRLASPFTYSTWNGPSRSNGQHRRQISQNQFDTVHATGSRLLSPFKLEPDVSLNVNKRRAQHNLEDELSLSGSNIGNRESSPNLDVPIANAFEQKPDPGPELVFTGTGDLNQRRIRLRNRGATLGAVSNREQFERLFAPPTAPTPTLGDPDAVLPPVPSLPASLMALATATATTSHPSRLAPPDVDSSQKRLGSPFELDPNKRSHRLKSPRHVPSLSDPFISTSAFTAIPGGGHTSSMSIGERLAMFSSLHQQHAQLHQQAPTRDDPFA